jgi:osmotically-inducible protein OsmY
MSHDTQLRDQVLAELSWDPTVNAAHIGVTAHHGVITLTGHVSSFAEKRAAETAASRVRDVKAVAEEIKVDLFAHHARTDEEIAQAALSRLSWNSYLPQNSIKVFVEKGWVTLSGTVDQNFQKISAERDIIGLTGVTGLTNQTRITSTIDALNVSNEIRNALDRSWFFMPNSIDVFAEGTTITLTGKVTTLHERKIANAIAWAAPGVTAVVDKMELLH